MISLAWLILWIPFVTAVVIFFFFLHRPRAASWLATATAFSTFLLTLLSFVKFLGLDKNAPPIESSVLWMSLGDTPIEFGILLNGLSLLMLLIVTGISALIFLYSQTYMEKEEGLARYFAALSFFLFSMLGIVLANNLIQLFIFWELVGVSSYFLIGFWYEKPEAATAGKKAFLTTRVGDVGMMFGILLLFGFLAHYNFATFNLLQIQERLTQIAPPPALMTLIALLLFSGVVGKSAQMPLHVWLPDAMEGPTPVSALIHAATMVAAGVYFLARFFFLFMQSPEALAVISWTGGMTAFMTATLALTQNDIKKVLAYSTLSQLGLMVMAIGLRSSEAGMFHLTTHAFFKALLFLGAGSLIHATHTQNIWRMGHIGLDPAGGFLKKMPVTTATFALATIALIGIYPFSGFFSKEEILIVASSGPPLLFWMALATVFFTAFYMGRLFTVVFVGWRKKRGVISDVHFHPLKEADWKITLTLVVLGIFSVAGGLLPIRELLPDRTFFEESFSLTQLTQILAAGGFLFAFLVYQGRLHGASESFPALKLPKFVFDRKYFFDDAYDFLIRHVQENMARACDWFERKIVVDLWVNGTARMVRTAGDGLRQFETGVVQFYAAIFTIGVTILMTLFILVGK